MAFSAHTCFVRRLRVDALLCGLTAFAAMEDINPECILPMCERGGDQHIGTWKALMVLEDQVVLQVGFAKAPHQAACVKIDIEGVPHRLAHVKKQTARFVTAVGGPQQKINDMPTVTMLE